MSTPVLLRSANPNRSLRWTLAPVKVNVPDAPQRGGLRQRLKSIAAHLPLSRQAAIVRHCLPRRYWYRAALTMARLQGRVVGRMGGNQRFNTVLMLDLWLRELSFGGPYPIPYRVTGGDVVRTPGPLFYTWTHLPLTEVPLRVGLEEGCLEPAIVSDPGKVVDQDRFLVFGWPKKIEALPADSHLLGRVKTALRSGKPVVFLSDQLLGGPLSQVPLRVAARLRVPVVFQWAELGEDGVLDVFFQFAPFPYSETEAELEANLAFMRERNRMALERLGWKPS